MTSDYYKPLHKRAVTQTDDGASGYTETTSDSLIQGYIHVLSGSEYLKSQKMSLNASARLHTKEVIHVKDRIVDTYGHFSLEGTVFEVVYPNMNPHTKEKYYDLRQI